MRSKAAARCSPTPDWAVANIRLVDAAYAAAGIGCRPGLRR